MKKITILLMLLPLTLFSQETMVITGRITNFKTGEALAGANVLVVGTPYGAATSAVGIYEIAFPLGTTRLDSVTISVNYIGYKNSVLKIPVATGRVEIDFYLIQDAVQLDEVVVRDRFTGASEKDKARGYAGAIINREQIEKSTASNLYTMLELEVPGIRVEVGGAQKKIIIRGKSPLIVVDDIPMRWEFDLNTIPRSVIESIEVIKGPAMFGRYGKGAANGCILIWTKKSTFEHK